MTVRKAPEILSKICAGSDLIKRNYEKNNIPYTIYEGNNIFFGTPIPEGYEAVYKDDGIVPCSLKLRKIEGI